MPEYLKLRFMDDLKAEGDLSTLGVSFAVQLVPQSKVDLVVSKENKARPEPIVEHKVEEYMTAWRNGATLPRLVGYWGKAGFVIISGIQRDLSIERFIEAGELPPDYEFEAYVVDSDDKMLLDIFPRAANVGHGEGLTKDVRIAQAVYCVRNRGMVKTQAAALFAVAATTIGGHMRADKEREELGSAGINLDTVPNSSVEPLAKITDIAIKRKVAHLVAQHNPGSEKVLQVAGAIAKAKSQSVQLLHVKELEKELSETARRSGPTRPSATRQPQAPKRPRRDRLIRELRTLADYLDFGMDGEGFTKLDDCQIANPGDKKTIRELNERINFRMTMILK